MTEQPRPKVLVTRCDYPIEGIDILQERCIVEIWPEQGYMPRYELLKRVRGKDAIYGCLVDRIDQDVIDTGKDLKVISTMSVGVDHLDIDAICEAGIKIGYTPDVLTEATAELTIALLLATSRRLFEANKALKTGGWTAWSPLWMCGPALSGSTVGIYGMGRIGLSVAKKLLAFNVAQILYAGRSKKPEGDEINAKFVEFDTLLKESDFVIVTCALTQETRKIFTAEKFALMKPTAIFVNTSRGNVVDQVALIDALKNKKIRGAGLDVMSSEPIALDSPLARLNNCVVTPHIGSATIETRREMAILSARNVVAGLYGEPMPAEYIKKTQC